MLCTLMSEEFLLIGRIVSPFGVRGQLKFAAVTDRPDYIRRHVRTLYLGAQRATYTLAKLHEHKPGLFILGLRGVDSHEAAEELRGEDVYINAAEAAPLDKDEYFLHQLVGLTVQLEDGQELGKVREVLETGASDVLVIARPGQPDALVPMAREFIIELNVAQGRLVVRPIEGLL